MFFYPFVRISTWFALTFSSFPTFFSVLWLEEAAFMPRKCTCFFFRVSRCVMCFVLTVLFSHPWFSASLFFEVVLPLLEVGKCVDTNSHVFIFSSSLTATSFPNPNLLTLTPDKTSMLAISTPSPEGNLNFCELWVVFSLCSLSLCLSLSLTCDSLNTQQTPL